MCHTFFSQVKSKKERTDFYFFSIYQTFLVDFSLYAYLINPFTHSSADVRITRDLENMGYMEKINTV